MLQINQLKIKVNIIDEIGENAAILKSLSKQINTKTKDISNIKIIKKSLDARYKPDLYYIYTICFSLNGNQENQILKRKIRNISEYKTVSYNYNKLNTDISDSPVIVGSGPAGLFCALYLIKAGLKPIIIERGSAIEQREEEVNNFWDGKPLNCNSNIQFGEGGAGTFSDGKLNTGVKDKYGRITEVLKLFHEFGCPENITYDSKPHIGTDILKNVIKNIRNYIINNGGSYRFNCRLIDINIEKDTIKSITIESNKQLEIIETNKLVLAIGHSARDTYEMLFNKKVEMSNKPFAVGFRILHPQEIINKAMYGESYKEYYQKLPASSYKVTYNTEEGRGIYSFCMCPGGYVVNASSEENRLCVNGMSYSGRDSDYANSAIVITIDEKDYGNKILDGMYYQRNLEEKAFNLNQGKITLQRFSDFENNIPTTDYNGTPAIKGLYCYGSVNDILPDNINKDIIDGIHHYGKSIKDFDSEDALLCGIEARTSSPVRILRDENYESNIKGIYPCGEGAGYAGGITSAAVDGLKVAESLVYCYNLQA